MVYLLKIVIFHGYVKYIYPKKLNEIWVMLTESSKWLVRRVAGNRNFGQLSLLHRWESRTAGALPRISHLPRLEMLIQVWEENLVVQNVFMGFSQQTCRMAFQWDVWLRLWYVGLSENGVAPSTPIANFHGDDDRPSSHHRKAALANWFWFWGFPCWIGISSMNNPGLKFLKSLLQSNYLWGVGHCWW